MQVKCYGCSQTLQIGRVSPFWMRSCLLQPSLTLSPSAANFQLLEASVVDNLGIELEAKALLPNSATATHTLTCNLVLNLWSKIVKKDEHNIFM